MKKIFLLISFLIFSKQKLFAQKIDTILLKIVNIKDLKDCYILTTINGNNFDTLYLISEKDTLNSKCNYERMYVNRKYRFELYNTAQQIAELPIMLPDHFSIRVKNTVVWRGVDGLKKFPITIKNSKGLYIRKRNWQCLKLSGSQKRTRNRDI